jgi:hypothetical protein
MRSLGGILLVLVACGSTPRSPIAATPIASFEVTPPVARYVDQLDAREMHEQLRDWAVLGAVGQMGVTPEDAAKATFEIPPARLSYLDDLYGFDYGYGRRVYLKNRVLLFDDASDPDPELTLGRLADRVRMENGDLPAAIELYVIRAASESDVIHVDRVADVPTADLFSTKYGYVAATVSDAASLGAWLGSVDDVTYVAPMTDGGLELGGRRFANTRTANITLEDVAALYQTHRDFETKRQDAIARVSKLRPGVKEPAEKVLELARSADPDPDEEEIAFLALVSAEKNAAKLAAINQDLKTAIGQESPGFSLDPEWLPNPNAPNEPLLADRMRTFAKGSCRALNQIATLATVPDDTRRTSREAVAEFVKEDLAESADAKSVCSALDRNVAPGLRLISAAIANGSPDDWDESSQTYQSLVQDQPDLSLEARQLASTAITFYEEDTKVQCARYTGIQGTSVAMTMFYTDLLAKIWLLDFDMAAPVTQLPGFQTLPRIPVQADENWGNDETRLWFGPRADNVSRTTDQKILFGHRFTRVYAAGNNPAIPGFETQPNEESRRALNWFDRHFDDIADYEPQYHRLNQITKWSLITAALVTSGAADYLAKIDVRRDLRFNAWQQANCDLRFRKQLPALNTSIAGKECVPLLSSYDYTGISGKRVMKGGVSTATTDAPKRLPVITTSAGLGERRRPIDDLGAGTAGTATRATPIVSGTRVTFAHGDSVPTVAPEGYVRLDDRVTTYGEGGAYTVHIGGADSVGKLTVERDGHMVFTEGTLEKERLGEYAAPEVSASSLARDYLTKAKARQAGPALKELTKLDLAKLDPATRDAVTDATLAVGTLAAGAHVAAGPDARTDVKLALIDGKIAVTRDVKSLPSKAVGRPALSQLDDAIVYVDSSLTSREGFVPDLGESVARMYDRRQVTVEELDASAVGDVLPPMRSKRDEDTGESYQVPGEYPPDQLHDISRHRIYKRVAGGHPYIVVPGGAAPRIVIVRAATASETLANRSYANGHCDR